MKIRNLPILTDLPVGKISNFPFAYGNDNEFFSL